jgi:hypothetical protein
MKTKRNSLTTQKKNGLSLIRRFVRKIKRILAPMVKNLSPIELAKCYKDEFHTAINGLPNTDKRCVVLVGEFHKSFAGLLNHFSQALSEFDFYRFVKNDLDIRELPGWKSIVFPLNLVRGPYDGPSSTFKATMPVKISADLIEKIKCSKYMRWYVDNFYECRPEIGKGYPETIAAESARYFKEAFDRLNPRCVMIWNPYVARNQIADGVAREKGIPVVYCESGMLPGTISLNTVGLFGASRLARNPEKFSNLPLNEVDLENTEKLIVKLRNKRISRYDGESHKPRLYSRPVVLFAGQFDGESGIIPEWSESHQLQSPIFKNSDLAVDFLAELAKKNNWQIIHKLHPLAFEWGAMEDEKENLATIGKGNILDFIDIADVVIAISGSTPYLALIREKPVVMIGYTTLKNAGCCYEAFRLIDIEKQIKSALRDGFTQDQKKAFIRHAALLNQYYLFDNCDPAAMKIGLVSEKAVDYMRKAINGNAEF